MPVTVVVGGQFGSEGKGKICAHLALTDNIDYMVRCGGPNSGHTVYRNGRRFQLRQVPAGFVNPHTRLLIAAGALVAPDVFLQEVEQCKLGPERIGIDRNAGVIEPGDLAEERKLDLRGQFGSTAAGVGSAVSRRALRRPDFRQAQDHPDLRPFITSVRDELGGAVRKGQSVVVEGTQGFGLSLYHADEWPYRTSRDTTAHSFLGEVGLGVRSYEVIMALRTYPIRVAGNSGPLPREITWEELQLASRCPHPIEEYTTTKLLRRVARFDWAVVRQAVAANGPTQLALHGADYLDHANYGVTEWASLTASAHQFVNDLEDETGTPVTFIGTGLTNAEIVDRRAIRQGNSKKLPARTPTQTPQLEVV